MPRQRKTPPLLDDGMPEAERRALDAALDEAIEDIRQGRFTTWDEGLKELEEELLRRKQEQAA